MKTGLCVAFLLAFFTTPGFAGNTETIRVKIDPPALSKREIDGTANFPDEPVCGMPGQPALPLRSVRVLLPPDIDSATVQVSIDHARWVDEPGAWDVSPASPAIIPDENGVPQPVWPIDALIENGRDTTVYAQNSFLPESVLNIRFGSLRGYRVATVSYAPFQWNPASGALRRLAGGTLAVSFGRLPAPTPLAPVPSATRERILRDLRETTVNFEAVIPEYETAAPMKAAAGAPETYNYVILTTSNIVASSESLDDFIASKTNRGFRVKVAVESDWGGGANGEARIENIRSWLQNNYQTLGIEYVLFIGDYDDTPNSSQLPFSVPMRRITATTGLFGWEGIRPWSDYYYAELDGNWDIDGDGYYGEWGTSAYADFQPGGAEMETELLVGRIPYYGSQIGMPVFTGTGLDDLERDVDSFTNTVPTLFHVRISSTTGTVDQFEVALDGGAWGAPVDITGGDQPIGYGATLSFETNTGHTVGDRWDMQARDFLDPILENIIVYEQTPFPEITNRFRALLVLTNPLGSENPGHPLGENIKNNILAPEGDWDWHRVYIREYGLIPPPETTGVNYANVFAAWTNTSPGLFVAYAHGNPTRINRVVQSSSTVYFPTSPPCFTVQFACNTANQKSGDNLAYAFLRSGSSICALGGSNKEIGAFDTNFVGSGGAALAYEYVERLIDRKLSAGDALFAAREENLIGTVPHGLAFSFDWHNYCCMNIYGCPDVGFYTHDETVAPNVYPDYPQIHRQDNNGFDLYLRVSENGTAHSVILDHGAPAPSAVQIRNGQDASGTPVSSNRTASIAIEAHQIETVRINGLLPETEYDVYLCAEDGDGQFSIPAMTNAFTTTSDLFFGSVCGNILPQVSTDDGARWRVTTGQDTEWKESGDLLIDLCSTGNPYTIEFNASGLWTAPASTNFSVTDDTTQTVVGVYTEDAFEENDAWSNATLIVTNTLYDTLRCLDDDWYRIGCPADKKLTVSVSAGTNVYLAVWRASQNVGVDDPVSYHTDAQTICVNPTVAEDYYLLVRRLHAAAYTLQAELGEPDATSVTCAIEPAAARAAGARWRLTTGVETNWNDSGETISNLAWNVSYDVAFAPLPMWSEPPALSFALSPGEPMPLALAGTYVQTPGRTNEFPRLATVSSTACTQVLSADLDGDGDADLAFCNASQTVCLLNTNAAGAYGAPVSVGAGALYIALTDLNGDDRLDLVRCDASTENIIWHENLLDEPIPAFGADQTVRVAAAKLVDLCAVDLDGDGDNDLIETRTDWSDVTTRWLENITANGELWSEHLVATNAGYDGGTIPADIDGDGDMDLAFFAVDCPSYPDFVNKLDWLENLAGDGTVWKQNIVHFLELSVWFPGLVSYGGPLCAIDLDGDGKTNDLAAGVFIENQILGFHNRQGDGSAWTIREISTNAPVTSSLFAADMDGDGDADLLAGSDNSTVWFENRDAAGTAWTEHPVDASSGQTVCLADAVGDSRPDVFLGNASNLVWYGHALTDSDGDGIPDAWELLYSGSLTNMTASSNQDGDNLTDFQEWIAQTDPTNSASFFQINATQPVSGGDFVLSWSSATGRLYSIWWTTNLLSGFDAGPFTSNLPAAPPLNIYTDSVHSTEGKSFYRIGVQME